MKNYYLYEIKNNINGKIYVGIRGYDGDVSQDPYMGSGLTLKRSIKKNGIENFTKTILKTFDSWKEARKAEREIVTEEFVKREDTYNVSVGGQGGNTHAGMSEERRKLASERHAEANRNRVWKQESRDKVSARFKGHKLSQKQIDALKKANTGRKFTEEHKFKIGKTWRGKKRPDIGEKVAAKLTGRKLPPEHVAAITQNTPRGKQHFRAKRFFIDDMEFYILSDAAKMFGISYKTVKARLLSDKFPTWRYE